MTEIEAKKEWLTCDEAAAEYGHSADFWRQRAVEGAVVGRKNGHWVIQRASIEKFMTGAAPAPPGEPAPAPGTGTGKPPSLEQIVNARPEVVEARAKQAVAEAEAAARLARDSIKSADELVAKHKQADDRLAEIESKRIVTDVATAERERLLKEGEAKLEASHQALERDRELFENTTREKARQLEDKVNELKNTEANLIDFSKQLDGTQNELQKRRENLNSIENMKLAEKKKYMSRLERQRRAMPVFQSEMAEVARTLDEARFFNLSDDIMNDLDWMRECEPYFEKQADEILQAMIEDVENANRATGKMFNKPKEYAASFYNIIVPCLETVVRALRELKPENWPSISDEDEELLNAIENLLKEKDKVSGNNLVSYFAIEDIDRLEYLLGLETYRFFKISDDENTGGVWGLTSNQESTKHK